MDLKIMKIASVTMPWLIILTYIFYYLTAMEQTDFIYLFIGAYIFSLGSFIYLNIPDYPSSSRFYNLTTIMALMFLFIYSNVPWLNFTGLLLLCLCPVSLYLFLYSFIQSENRKLFKISMLILTGSSIYSFFSFILKIYPEFTLLLLLSISTTTSYITIYKERKLFFSSLSFKFLSFSVLLAFIPFIVSYSLPAVFSSGVLGDPRTALLVLVFPTCIACILSYMKTISLPDNLILNMAINILSFCFFIIISWLEVSLQNKLIVTLLFYFFCYLSHFLIQFIQQFKKMRAENNIEELNNEKIELLNQVTYSNFMNSVSNLLLNRLKGETNSSTILVMMQSNNQRFVLCQSGNRISRAIKKELFSSLSSKQEVTIRGNTYHYLSVSRFHEKLFVFIEKTDYSVDLDHIEDILHQYEGIITTIRKMHTNQQKYIDSSLGTTELLQAKLFNNLEKEKTKYTHYLHDSVLQSVIGLHTLVSNLHGDDEIESLVRIEFSKLIRSIRDEVFNISPSTLYYLSFEENIQILIEDFNHKYPEIEYLLIYQLNGELPKHLVAPVYRVIKELNENIGKHSQATYGITKILNKKNILSIVIEDNGKGIHDYFKIEKNLFKGKEHIGLLSIKNDLKWLNGSFEISPMETVNSGTIIEINIPFEKGEAL